MKGLILDILYLAATIIVAVLILGVIALAVIMVRG